jgi:hypothetical protein
VSVHFEVGEPSVIRDEEEEGEINDGARELEARCHLEIAEMETAAADPEE